MMRNILLKLFLPAVCLTAAAENLQSDYGEKWRPQYHYTPAHRWIGDPCGLVHFNGKFHAYCWGAAESDDMIHWTEINSEAIHDIPKGTSPFTGSVAIDRNNSAGYGKNAFIAAFTSFDEQSKKQSQSIAFSHDEGRTFHYYDLNPVIDTWSTEFRDPTVLWDETSGRWIMAVAKALEKKVAFYGSDDLKQWQWLSDFGPAGDSEKSWECPDLFRLPVKGSGEKKWVLLVSVNWAREQYFTGTFDGMRFIPDSLTPQPLYVDAGLDYYASRTFQDYDGSLPGVYSLGWVSTWDYAQHVPTEYGKGVWSLPRELSLRKTAEGLRLVQEPVRNLRLLRGKQRTLSRRLKAGVMPLPAAMEMNNQYELSATFSTWKNDVFGINLCTGNDRKVTLTYDVSAQTLMLDRTNASERLIPKFERMAFAKVAPDGETLNLDIFVDKSVIEVYANGGECVMTALIFPGDADTGAEMFSLRGGNEVSLSIYPMASVWRNSSVNPIGKKKK
ncbi:MAG: glycoside hydrolase family 32 protein [Bacteroidales bacterium]|nr:glycoside hydrolase family 32 protein [Bacteroidales bacterium]MCM1146549.1 glycoside hydrolase family 32 protein [Bacteroidales bacterium]MCM1205941.1 glycoside hydrolase family 32 protein [Bacillota bacterium]MCM1510181.1 glycoside hydrolase family 32 protein [Clostridium sp.]